MNDAREQKSERSIRDDIRVNRFQLEIAAEEFSEKYRYWSDWQAEVKSERDRLKTKLKSLKAEKGLYYKDPENPLPGGMEAKGNRTDGLVTLAIDADPDVQSMEEELNGTQSLLNDLDSAVSCMDKAHDDIKILKELFCNQYYRKRTGYAEEASDAVTKALNKKED